MLILQAETTTDPSWPSEQVRFGLGPPSLLLQGLLMLNCDMAACYAWLSLSKLSVGHF